MIFFKCEILRVLSTLSINSAYQSLTPCCCRHHLLFFNCNFYFLFIFVFSHIYPLGPQPVFYFPVFFIFWPVLQVHTGLLLPFDTEIVIAAEVNRRSGLFSVKLSVTIPKIRFICDPRQLEGTFIVSTYTFLILTVIS